MVDGHVGGALLELVRDGVAAVAHDLHHERVGLADGRSGLVDEAALRGPPAIGVAVAGRGVELADLEPVVALAALEQLRLSLLAVASLGDGPLVLGAEALLQLLGSALARKDERTYDQGDQTRSPRSR